MSTSDPRLRDAVLLGISIQLSILGTEPADGSLLPLFFVGILITAVVAVREAARLLSAYTEG